jgi:LysR family transcriptional regulator of gallate degradation
MSLVEVPKAVEAAADGTLMPFDLNLRHLRGLLAVRDQGSVSAAAAAVSLSQPALTQGIVKLEHQLGNALFERRPNGMVTTSAGTLVMTRVQAALSQLTIGARFAAGPDFEPDRRLTMTQLRAVLALVDAGTFAAAADRIGSSQPAVHRSVHELEASLDKKLTERRGRGVCINFTGKRFARSCRLALAELQAAFSELGIDPHDPTIAVGTTPLARAFIVPEAMALMTAECFPAGFRVLEGSWSELVETLRDGVIDVIVGELPPHESPDLVKTPLYEESLVIVAGRQHPLVGRAQPSLKTLRSYPWIVGPEESPLRAEWARLFGDALPSAPIECGSIMIIGRLLTSSNLLTLAMPDQVALQIRTGLLSRIGSPVGDRKHTIGTTMRKSWHPTSAQRRFLERLREASLVAGIEGTRKALVDPNWV